MGVIARNRDGLAAGAATPKTVMIDAACLKAHRTATSPLSKQGGRGGRRGRLTGRAKGGMNARLHAVTDADGRPIRVFMTGGQVSVSACAAARRGSLPNAGWLLAGRGHDADRV
jgi:hypothetical protein